MSLTIIFGYIVISMIVYMFFNYKFLKIFDDCTSFCLRKTSNIFTPKQMAQPAVVRRQPSIWDIPGPKCLPICGTKWIFFFKYKLSRLHEVHEDFARIYGPIVLEVYPFNIPVVNLFNAKDIEKVLRYPSKYPFRPPTEILSIFRKSRPDRYASVGITNEQGLAWHLLRTKLTPAITSPRILNAFLPTLNDICDDFLELLKQQRCPHTYIVDNFQDVANLMGLEAVCTLMLGRRMGFLSATPGRDITDLAAAVKTMFRTQRDSTFGMHMWKYFPTKTWRDFRRSEELIYRTISEIVDRAMEENRSDADANENDIRSVFLGILNEDDLDIREKKSAIIDFISAGIETLANTLSFVLYFTSQSSRDLDNIYAEFRHCGKQIDVNDLSSAIYTKACLQETYRISPTALCLARVLEEDTILSGYELKAGTFVLCHTRVACNSDENYQDARTFRPSRWLDTPHVDGSLILPFGIGRRMCPGRRFVEMELITLLAKMVCQFDMTYCGELETEFEFLLVPKSPVGIRLRDRTPTTGA